MNNFVKGALIFSGGVAGGFVLCGVTTIKFVVKSNTFRTALKDKIANEVTTFLYGEKQPSKVTYRRYSDVYKHRTKSSRQIDIILETRKDAENVIDYINEIFKNYGVVYFADLCDLCGITGNYTDNKYGWIDSKSINKFYVVSSRYGYQLKYPEPVTLG